MSCTATYGIPISRTSKGSEIGKFEKSRVKMYCLTKKGKRLLVRVIWSFAKSRVREIGIPLLYLIVHMGFWFPKFWFHKWVIECEILLVWSRKLLADLFCVSSLSGMPYFFPADLAVCLISFTFSLYCHYFPYPVLQVFVFIDLYSGNRYFLRCMLKHTKRQVYKWKFYNLRCLVMFITEVCLLFLLKLKWPKNKSDRGCVFEFKLFVFSRLILKFLRFDL